jgi:hypothetical protein
LVVVVFGLFPSPLMSVMQAASEPMLTATGGWASMVSFPSATGYAPVPPVSTKPAPAAKGLDPETAKNYGLFMKATRTPSRAPTSKSAPAKKAEAEPKTKSDPAKKAEAAGKTP